MTALEERCLLSGNVWTQRGGNAGHTSFVDVSLDPASIADAWNQPLNYVASATGSWSERAVAIDETHVYRTDVEGYAPVGTYHVIAYDLQTGTPVWNQSIVGNGGGGVGEPSVAGGIVYVNRAGHSGISGGTAADLPRLYGLSGQTGATMVQTTYAAQWASNERPVIADNQLVAWDGYYGGFSARSTATLARQWNNPGSIYDIPIAAMDDRYVYAYGNQVYLRTTGARQTDITHPLGLTLSDPIVSDSGLLLYRAVGFVAGVQKTGVAAYDGATHSLLWTADTPAIPGGKAVGNGLVAVTAGSQLIFLDEATGAQVGAWQAPANLISEIVLTRTHAFVESASSGSARVYAVNLATTQVDWSFENRLLGESSNAAMEMAFGGGYLLLSTDAFVRAFDVTAGNRPPTAGDDSATTVEDTAVTINVLANDNDPDGGPLTIAAVGTPSHGSATLNADGTITYIPAANSFGADHFTYTILDPRGSSATATVSLAVTPVNDAPVASHWQFVTNEDTPLNDFLRASDVDGDSLHYVIEGLPVYGTIQLNPATGTFTYTPAPNFNGNDSFTFKVDDGKSDSNVARVFISVRPVNDAPTAQDDAYAAEAGTPLLVGADFGVLANDSDVEGDSLAAVLATTPTKGMLALNGDGSLTYTPNTNANGTDSFTYKATDGALESGLVTVTITINAAQHAPVAVAGPDQAANEAAVVAFDGRGSYDADNDGLTYSWNFGDGGTGAGPTPTHVYTDDGTYTIVLTVSDGQGNSSVDTLLVTVNNVAPVVGAAGPPTGVRGQTRTFAFTAGDVSSVDQAGPFTYTIQWGDGSAPVTLQGSASRAVDHVFTASGTFTVLVTVTDKDGGTSSPISRTITVGAFEMQDNTLVIGGTLGADTILIKPGSISGTLTVTINGASLGAFRPTGQILVYAQAGADVIELQTLKVKSKTTYVTVPAILDGGIGNDTIDAQGSRANNVLLGSDDADTLRGGSGRDLLVGGLGADLLRAGDGDDILIGGATDFDSNLAALTALRTEWGRLDLSYLDRIDHLTGATGGGWNGPYLLTPLTVPNDEALDQLYGEAGQDWFLGDAINPWTDVLNDKSRSERATKI